MSNFLKSLANLLRLRSGPQDLPTSWLLTIVLVTVFLLQNLSTGLQTDDSNAAAKSLMGIGIQIIVLLGLLNWRHHPERFTQTLSALVGAGIVFNGISWVLLTQSDPGINQPMLALIWFTVFIWSLFVDANIYRHALSLTLSTGMLVTVLILAASYSAIELLFVTNPL